MIETNSAEYNFYYRKRLEEQESPNSQIDYSRMVKAGEHAFVKGARYHLISQRLSSSNVGSLLEIGCGNGSTVAYMRKWAKTCIGADIALRHDLNSFRDEGLSFVEFNANDNFPFSAQSFDVVVAMMVMEHVFDPFHFCSEVSRVLNANGLFFLNVPLITALKHRLALLGGQMPVTSNKKWFEMREWDGGHLHYFTLPLLSKLLNLYGLKIIKVSAVGKFSHIKTLLPGLLAAEISICCHKTSEAKV